MLKASRSVSCRFKVPPAYPHPYPRPRSLQATPRLPSLFTLIKHTHSMANPTIPKTMRAAVIYEAGGPEVLKLETRPVPTPKRDEVLIQIKAFGLCVSLFFLFPLFTFLLSPSNPRILNLIGKQQPVRNVHPPRPLPRCLIPPNPRNRMRRLHLLLPRFPFSPGHASRHRNGRARPGHRRGVR
jgi:hypothetical protein